MDARRLAMLAAGLIGTAGWLAWAPADDGLQLQLVPSAGEEPRDPYQSSGSSRADLIVPTLQLDRPVVLNRRAASAGLEVAGAHLTRTVVKQMAAALDSEDFDRSTWDRRVRAVAGSLGASSAGTLFQITWSADCSVAEHVAAAELLGVLRAQSDSLGKPLGAPALSSLRRAVLESEDLSPLSVAAGRALAAWGGRADRESLLSILAESDDEKRRSWIAWSLPAATASDVGYSLLGLVGEDDCPERMLGALSRWVQGQPNRELEPAFVQAVSAEVEGLLWRRDTSPATRQGALGTLSELGAAASVTVLERLILDPAPSGCEPLQLAEAWSRLPEVRTQSPLANAEVGELLRRAAQDSVSPSERRRALFALAGCGQSVSTTAIAMALQSDPEPSVRAAADWVIESSSR